MLASECIVFLVHMSVSAWQVGIPSHVMSRVLSCPAVRHSHYGHTRTQARKEVFSDGHSFVSYTMGMYTYALHRAFIVGTGCAGALRWDRRLVLILVFANCVFAPLDLADAVARVETHPMQAGLRFVVAIVSVCSLYKGFVFSRLLRQSTTAVTPVAPSPSVEKLSLPKERPSVFMTNLGNIAPNNSIATLRLAGFAVLLSFLSWQVEGAAYVLAATWEPQFQLQNVLSALASGCNFGVHAIIVVSIMVYRLVQVCSSE